MIQQSINQMLGAFAVGGKLYQQDVANQLGAETENYKSNIASQEAIKRKQEALKRQNESMSNTLETNKKLTDEQRLNLQQDINSNVDEIEGMEKTLGEYSKELSENKKNMLDLARLKETEPGKVDPKDKKPNTFTKGNQANVIKTLREGGIGRIENETEKLNKDTQTSLLEENARLSKEEQMAQKARMSMVRKARQQIIQANNNFITNFGKSNELPPKMREFVENEMKKGGNK